jgi:hypothetical protein
VERKIFWITFTLLGSVADFVLPLWWALGATIPIGFVSWWWLIAAIGFSSAGEPDKRVHGRPL